MSVSFLSHPTYSEPRSFLAGVLAVLVHLIFVALLIFGLKWKDHPPEGMTVDIWAELPQSVQGPKKTQPPLKQFKPVQEPVKAKSELGPKPEPPKAGSLQPQPSDEESDKSLPTKSVLSPVKKPDIAMRQRPEQVNEIKPRLEEKRKLEQEKVKEQERLKEIEIKKDREKQKELERQKKLQKQKEEERVAQQHQREKETEAQREAEALRAVQQAQARNNISNEIPKYKAMILAKIRSRIVMPLDLPGNPVVEFNVTLLPGGDILNIKLIRSSGYTVFDNAVEGAIFLSKPLPLPPDPVLFSDFRNLNITVHYRE